MTNLFGKPGEWRIWVRMTCLILAAAGAFQCSKSIGSKSNKANVIVVHTAQGHGALDFGKINRINNPDSFTSLLPNPLSYGMSTGVSNTRFPFQDSALYREVDVGVSPIGVRRTADDTIVSAGNTTFNFGRSYSIFLFDDSAVVADTVRLFTLPDNIRVTVDTFAYIRWLNFSPSSYLNIRMDARRAFDNRLDSFLTGFLNFVGDRQVISTYNFRQIHPGFYSLKAFYDVDSVTRLPKHSYPLADSINIVRDKFYTAFVQGFHDSSGEKKLRIRVIQHN